MTRIILTPEPGSLVNRALLRHRAGHLQRGRLLADGNRRWCQPAGSKRREPSNKSAWAVEARRGRTRLSCAKIRAFQTSDAASDHRGQSWYGDGKYTEYGLSPIAHLVFQRPL